MKKEVAPEQKTSSALNINDLWRRYYKAKRNGNGVVYRNILMEQYQPLVKIIAAKFYPKVPSVFEFDELESAGEFGLEEAIESYNAGLGVKFETHASYRIKGAVLDALREIDWVPRVVRSRTKQLEKVSLRLEKGFGRKPTEEELIKELSKKKYKDYNLKGIKKAKAIIRDGNIKRKISLFNNNDDENGKSSVMNYIRYKNSQNPILEAQKKELKEILTEGLTRAEKLIIILYYYEEMTMKEIGATFELSESRVSQLHKSILARLKAKLTAKGYSLEELL